MSVTAILLDLDGVLYVGDDPLPDAARTVHKLRESGFSLAGITNTTTQSRHTIGEKLARMDIPLAEDQIHTPAALAVARIGNKNARLFVRSALREDFSGIRENRMVCISTWVCLWQLSNMLQAMWLKSLASPRQTFSTAFADNSAWNPPKL